MIANKSQRAEEKYLEPEARWVRNEERKRGTPLTQTVGKDKVRQSQTNLLTEQQKASQTTTGLDVEVETGTVPNATVKHCHAVCPRYYVLYLGNSGVHTAIIAALPSGTKSY